MSEQEAFSEWFNKYTTGQEYYFHGYTDKSLELCWQACAERKDKIIEKQAAELAALREGFIALINVAERCDSWESFPSNALDAAYKCLEGSK